MFNAISPINGGTLATYYNDKSYPIDLNGSQDYSRESISPPAFYPFPVVIGALPVLNQFFDKLAFQMGYGKNPSGPWAGLPQAPLNVAFPDIRGGLIKEA